MYRPLNRNRRGRRLTPHSQAPPPVDMGYLRSHHNLMFCYELNSITWQTRLYCTVHTGHILYRMNFHWLKSSPKSRPYTFPEDFNILSTERQRLQHLSRSLIRLANIEHRDLY